MGDSQKLSSNMKSRHKFPLQDFQKSQDQNESFEFGTSFVVVLKGGGEFGLRSSSLPPNSSSPSLSIPPELFHNYLKLEAHHSKSSIKGRTLLPVVLQVGK
ncbi:unnamed protein product [Malus baccata var. baccata]